MGILHFFICFVLGFLHVFLVTASNVHIVFTEPSIYQNLNDVEETHYKILANVFESKETAVESVLYSYKSSISGFAAKLTHSQAKIIAGHPGVSGLVPNRILSLHTTHSWDFLHLGSSFSSFMTPGSRVGEDTIVGVIDTGIWPESESFSDSHLGPVPSRWKGVCKSGELFNNSHCNKKIIGARWYIKAYEAEFGPLNKSDVKEFLSPRDAVGHGTHTSSIAVGGFVQNVSFMGLAAGVARGGAPHARIATYKVCWATGDCSSADILAAFEDAINDGVDVLSVSLGSAPPLIPYFEDPIAVGSFHAIMKGITVVCSGGNSGPFTQTVINTAPWLITVAASTIDRTFPTTIDLGDGQTLKGESLNTIHRGSSFHRIVYAEDIASADKSSTKARACDEGSLNSTLAKGKFVLCFQVRGQRQSSEAALTVYNAGGIGVIYAQIPTKTIVCPSLIPCVQVDFEAGTKMLSYLQSSRYPVLRIGTAETTVGRTLAPEVAYFSSRGPSSLSPNVLKPDIAAPGVNILAAWAPMSPPSDMQNDKRLVEYNIVSGTSMACPHISGIVALLKGLYPVWSPAAIKSALITTASISINNSLSIAAEAAPWKVGDPFDYGGGNVDPTRAANPGLVYDMRPEDFTPFLCSMGYNKSSIHIITGKHTICSKKLIPVIDLNLPSFAMTELSSDLITSRTVTNVGPKRSLYRVRIESPPGVDVIVNPSVLSFNTKTEKLTFKVTFHPTTDMDGRYTFGAIVWSDGNHTVRSPIAVRTGIQ